MELNWLNALRIVRADECVRESLSDEGFADVRSASVRLAVGAVRCRHASRGGSEGGCRKSEDRGQKYLVFDTMIQDSSLSAALAASYW